MTLSYRHSRLAERLIAAGHISESREYAIEQQKDPFRLPRSLRKIALGRSGVDFDDKAAFPYAKMALVRPCKNAIQTFLTHREPIMTQMGEYLLPDTFILGRNDLPPPGSERDREIKSIRRDGMKALFNSLDVIDSVARARRGVGPTSGITVKRTPGARAVVVMPQVTGTSGLGRWCEARGPRARLGPGWILILCSRRPPHERVAQSVPNFFELFNG